MSQNGGQNELASRGNIVQHCGSIFLLVVDLNSLPTHYISLHIAASDSDSSGFTILSSSLIGRFGHL